MKAAPLALLAFAAPVAAQGGVTEVFGNGTFLTIGDAANHAADGDVLLVNQGLDDGFTIDGKSLAVVAEVGATPVVRGEIQVLNLAADQTVVLRGLRIHYDPVVSFPPPSQLVWIHQCAGEVRLEDCVVEGASNSAFGVPAVRATGSASVVLSGCTLVDAVHPASSPTVPSGGLVVDTGSHVTVTGGSLRGAQGTPGECSQPGAASGGGEGGPAAHVVDGFLLLSSAALEGGRGGPPGRVGSVPCDCDALPGIGGHPGGGGPALLVEGRQSEVWSLASRFRAGRPGESPLGCPPSAGSPARVVTAGTYRPFTGPGLRLHTTAPVRELGTLELRLQGPPSAPAVLGLAPATSDLFLPSLKGSLLLGGPVTVVQLGVLSQGGLSLALPVGTLPPGFDSALVFVQGAVLLPDTVLGGFSTVVVLDESF